MNPALHVTYDYMVFSYAARAGWIDVNTGVPSLTTGQRVTFDLWLTNMMKEAWDRPRGRDWVWKFTVLTNPDMPVVNGVIDPTEIEYGVWVSLWTSDPRPVGTNACPVAVRMMDNDGIYPETTEGSVFALYVRRSPEFNSTPWAANTAYNLGTVRYDAGTGQCFRALQDVPNSGIALTDEDYWEEMLIPRNFVNYLTMSVYSLHLGADGGQDGRAAKMQEMADDDLEREYVQNFRDSPMGSGKPLTYGGIWM
jgi:hypothetical protein